MDSFFSALEKRIDELSSLLCVGASTLIQMT